MNVRWYEKGLPIPKTTWRLDPALKLLKVLWLIHNSLICHKFLFRNLSAFLHLYFHFCWFGCYWLQPKTGSSVFKTIQNHFQNWITFFAHFRPLNHYNKLDLIISPLKVLRKTPASPRFTKLARNDNFSCSINGRSKISSECKELLYLSFERL